MEDRKTMFSAYVNQKEREIRAWEAKYIALENEYFNVINSTFWRRSQPLRNVINVLRHNGATAATPAAPVRTVSASTPEQLPCSVPLTQGRLSPEKMLETLMEYDVVSFDIFDTLILRNVKQPKDVFDIVGLRLGYEQFSKLRIKAEEVARKDVQGDDKEVTLSDIYERLSKWLSIDKETAMEIEIQTEIDICTANPFMKKVFDTLRAMGKRIIIASDMYLPASAIERILVKCGYFGYEKLYVSCEYIKSKATGSLYELIKEGMGPMKVMHVGDNFTSDVMNATNSGWMSYYYPSVENVAGGRFLGCDSPASSIRTALCRNRLCSEPLAHGIGYSHGYAYGGAMSVGYVKWLDEFARQKDADKILFLARDSEIFDVIYRKHINRLPSKYMVVSRFSMWQIIFHIHTEEYIQFFFWNRALAANGNVKDALLETGLDFLVDKLADYELEDDVILDKKSYEVIRKMIYDNKELITEEFLPMRKAAIKYFERCFGDAKRVLVSDVGWSGQILLHLRHFVREVMKRDDIEIIGAYVANSINKNVNHYVNNGTLNAYLFSYGQNRDMSIPNDTWYGNTAVMCYEAMFSSVSPTLMRYRLLENGEPGFEYGLETGEADVINEIQRGILDFAYDWFKLSKEADIDFTITPADAFTPYEAIAMDWPYLERVFGDFKEYADSIPRLGKTRERITIREIMYNRALL